MQQLLVHLAQYCLLWMAVDFRITLSQITQALCSSPVVTSGCSLETHPDGNICQASLGQCRITAKDRKSLPNKYLVWAEPSLWSSPGLLLWPSKQEEEWIGTAPASTSPICTATSRLCCLGVEHRDTTEYF